jgi:hypothetical protein
MARRSKLVVWAVAVLSISATGLGTWGLYQARQQSLLLRADPSSFDLGQVAVGSTIPLEISFDNQGSVPKRIVGVIDY